MDDVERLELFLAHGIPEMISGLGVWIGATVWLFTVDGRLATAAAVVVPVAFWMMHVAMRRSEVTVPAAEAAEARMNVSIVEYVGGTATVLCLPGQLLQYICSKAIVVDVGACASLCGGSRRDAVQRAVRDAQALRIAG